VISVLFAVDALVIEGLALWITGLKEAAGGSYPPIWLQVPVSYLMTLWIWAMAAVFADWRKQSRGGRGHLYRQLRYWVFFLGAAELALVTLPRSLAFIVALPGTAIRGIRARAIPSPAETKMNAHEESRESNQGTSPTMGARQTISETPKPRPRAYLPGRRRIDQAVTEDGQLLIVEDDESPDSKPRIWTPPR